MRRYLMKHFKGTMANLCEVPGLLFSHTRISLSTKNNHVKKKLIEKLDINSPYVLIHLKDYMEQVSMETAS